MEWKIERDTTFSDLLTPRKLLTLLAFWLAGILILVTYGTVSACLRGSAGPFSVAVPTASGNETGPFSVRRGNPETTHRPAYRVRFDNLQAEPDALGPTAAACRTIVYIDNLDIAFLQPSPAVPPVGRRSLLADFRDLFAPSRDSCAHGAAPGLFEDLLGETEGWTVSVDLTNSTEVWVRGMDWRVCRSENTIFHVRCASVQLSAGTPDFMLRGDVMVWANGTTLESDCVRMDSRNDRIIVDGPYRLTWGEETRAGTGACFGPELTLIETQAPRGPEFDAAVATGAGRQWTDTLAGWLRVFDYVSPTYGPSDSHMRSAEGLELGQEPVFGPLPADSGHLSVGGNHSCGNCVGTTVWARGGAGLANER